MMLRRIFLAGVANIGKSTTGKALAELTGVRFFDLDDEIEDFFAATLAELQERLGALYHAAMARVVRDVIERSGNHDCVVSLSGIPSETVAAVVGETPQAVVVVLVDAPENIVERLVFYDDPNDRTRPVQAALTDEEKSYYTGSIKRDIARFAESFHAARFVDVAGLSPAEAADKVREAIDGGEASSR
jgi:shikimate kinase